MTRFTHWFFYTKAKGGWMNNLFPLFQMQLFKKVCWVSSDCSESLGWHPLSCLHKACLLRSRRVHREHRLSFQITFLVLLSNISLSRWYYKKISRENVKREITRRNAMTWFWIKIIREKEYGYICFFSVISPFFLFLFL